MTGFAAAVLIITSAGSCSCAPTERSIPIPTLSDPYVSISHHTRVAGSSDGKWAAIWLERHLFVWNLEAGEIVLNETFGRRVRSVVFAPDDNQIALTSGRRLDVYELGADQPIWKPVHAREWDDEHGDLICYTFGQPGKLFLGRELERQVLIEYDIATADKVRVIREEPRSVNDSILGIDVSIDADSVVVARVTRVDVYRLSDLQKNYSVEAVMPMVSMDDDNGRVIVGSVGRKPPTVAHVQSWKLDDRSPNFESIPLPANTLYVAAVASGGILMQSASEDIYFLPAGGEARPLERLGRIESVASPYFYTSRDGRLESHNLRRVLDNEP